MIYSIFLLLCTIHTSTIFASFTGEQKTQCPIMLTVNTYYDTQTTGPTVEVTQQTETKQAAVPVQPNTEMTTEHPKRTLDYIDQSLSQLYQHKAMLTASCILALYFYCYHSVQQAIKTINNPHAWCSWKESCSCAQLIVQPKEELMQQLLFDIYKQYFQNQTLSQNNFCFHKFVQDVAHEKNILAQYLYLKSWFKTLHCTKFFPCSVTTTVIKEKQARLEFIYDMFLHWHIKQCNTKNNVE